MKIKAPINIALIKYWGKASTDPVLPTAPSISLSLDAFHTVTTFHRGGPFSFTLNGARLSGEDAATIERFIERFTADKAFHISSLNSGPTAAGLASSASGYAALSWGLKKWFQDDLSWDALTRLTAYGSGSAVRSLLGGAVKWETDGTVTALPFNRARYRMAILLLDTQKKAISSRDKMAESMKLPVYSRFVQRNAVRALKMEQAMYADAFERIGTLMEESTLDMHALTALDTHSKPYLTSTSLALWHRIIALRQAGLKMYVTADAGPNLKILFETAALDDVETALKSFNVPYICSTVAAKGAHEV